MKKSLFLAFSLISLSGFSYEKGKVRNIQAKFETTPVPLGGTTTDDTAIWFNEMKPSDSLILGVNKNKEKDGGRGGVGLYTLEGQEIHFYEKFQGEEIGRLNNIDLRYNFPFLNDRIDIVVASNRAKDSKGTYKGLSIFSLEGDKKIIKHLKDIPLKDEKGFIHEPYGSCMGFDPSNKKYYVISPLENGKILQHEIVEHNGEISGELKRTIEMEEMVGRDQDALTINLTFKDVLKDYQDGEFDADGLNQEIQEKLGERFQMEGCVSDDFNGYFYVAMEKLGIFKFSLNPIMGSKAKLVASVIKSKNDKDSYFFEKGTPRLTDDVEGLALYHGANGGGYLVASIQGISEFAVFSRRKQNYLGSFTLAYGQEDSVTKTDGLEILSSPLGDKFNRGLMAVHDHDNTDQNGDLLNANYKIISFEDILKKMALDFLNPKDWSYNPRNLSK